MKLKDLLKVLSEEQVIIIDIFVKGEFIRLDEKCGELILAKNGQRDWNEEMLNSQVISVNSSHTKGHDAIAIFTDYKLKEN